MSSSVSGLVSTAGPSGPLVLAGTPVVPGVALGPVVRPSAGVRLPDAEQADLPEEARAAEKELFRGATGVSAEVLSTTAGMARDRALWGAAEQRIDVGVPAASATVQAAQQFVDM